MKNLATLLIILLSTFCMAQFEDEEIIRKTYRFEKSSAENVFQLSNINGSVKVETHSGDQIELIVHKIVSGKTGQRVEDGMSELQLGLIDRYDTLIVHVTGSCLKFGKYEEGQRSRYGYNWNNCNLKYDHKMDMTLKVPEGANLVLSTVNQGDITVAGVKGNLNVNNVNGAIALSGVQGKVNANTINGDLDIDYEQNPTVDSRYYTLNGDINANFRKGLSAKIAFKSFNGDMYTNLDLESLPVEVRKEKIKDNSGLKIKIDERMIVQSRAGSVMLDFETFNGDAIIKEK